VELRRLYRRVEPEPAQIPALGAAWVRCGRSSACGLGVHLAAPEAADRLEHPQRSLIAPRSRSHVQREAETCRNLRLAAALDLAAAAGVEGDPPHPAAIGARRGLVLLEGQVVRGAAVEAADERPFGGWLLLLHVSTDASPAPKLRDYTGDFARRVASTSRAICATSSSSLSKARSSRRRSQSWRTSLRP
jgi:hypothetical protein